VQPPDCPARAPEAVTELRRWRKAQREEHLAAGPKWDASWGDLVFAEPDGTPRRVDVYRRAMACDRDSERRRARGVDRGWRASAEAKPVPHTSPHALLHTYATHLLEHGTPIHHVAELLGDPVAVVESTDGRVLRPKHGVTSVVSRLVGSRDCANSSIGLSTQFEALPISRCMGARCAGVGMLALLLLVGCGGDNSTSMSDDDVVQVISLCTESADVTATMCDDVVTRFQRWGCTTDVAELGVSMLRTEVRSELSKHASVRIEKVRVERSEVAARATVNLLIHDRCES
jgi:hypothetical protein